MTVLNVGFRFARVSHAGNDVTPRRHRRPATLPSADCRPSGSPKSGPSSLRVRSPGRPGIPGLLRQEGRAGQAPHAGPALPRETPDRRSLRDAPRRTLHESRPTTRSHGRRLGQQDDPITSDVEAEHRMAVVALRIHQDRLAEASPHLPKEAAERIESLLALHSLRSTSKSITWSSWKRKIARISVAGQTRRFGHSASAGAERHALRPGHRQPRLAFGVLALPAPRLDKIKYRLPVLHRTIRDAHVRQRPHQVRVEEAAHVIPQKTSHTARVPGSPTQRERVSSAEGMRAPGGRAA